MKKKIVSIITAAALCIACPMASAASENAAETETSSAEASIAKTLREFGADLTDEQAETLLEAIKETVTTEYLEPAGIAPEDFEWESPGKEYNDVIQMNRDISVFWNGFQGDEVPLHISAAVMSGDAENIPELPDNANLKSNGTYDLINALYRGTVKGMINAGIEYRVLETALQEMYNEDDCFPFGQFIADNVKFE